MIRKWGIRLFDSAPAFGVHFGNFFYFLAIFSLFFGTAALLFLCRRFGKAFAKKLLLIILWANFALHFLKQFLPAYIAKWPWGLADSAFPNLCAVLIFIAPFIFMFGNVYLKDYLFYIGSISALLVYFVPTGAMRYETYPLGFADPEYFAETMRFYICHFPLVACSLIMVDQGFHTLDYHRLWAVPIMFCAILTLVALNAFFFGPILKLQNYPHDIFGPDGLLNRFSEHQEVANQSMAFGPQPNVDKALSWAYPFMIPGLQYFYVDGERIFTPVIWLLPYLYFGTALIGPLLALPFEHRHMALDWNALLQWRKMRKEERIARLK